MGNTCCTSRNPNEGKAKVGDKEDGKENSPPAEPAVIPKEQRVQAKATTPAQADSKAPPEKKETLTQKLKREAAEKQSARRYGEPAEKQTAREEEKDKVSKAPTEGAHDSQAGLPDLAEEIARAQEQARREEEAEIERMKAERVQEEEARKRMEEERAEAEEKKRVEDERKAAEEETKKRAMQEIEQAEAEKERIKAQQLKDEEDERNAVEAAERARMEEEAAMMKKEEDERREEEERETQERKERELRAKEEADASKAQEEIAHNEVSPEDVVLSSKFANSADAEPFVPAADATFLAASPPAKGVWGTTGSLANKLRSESKSPPGAAEGFPEAASSPESGAASQPETRGEAILSNPKNGGEGKGKKRHHNKKGKKPAI